MSRNTTLDDTLTSVTDAIIEEADAAYVDGYMAAVSDRRVDTAVSAIMDLKAESEYLEVLEIATHPDTVTFTFGRQEALDFAADLLGLPIDDEEVIALVDHSGWEIGLRTMLRRECEANLREAAYYFDMFVGDYGDLAPDMGDPDDDAPAVTDVDETDFDLDTWLNDTIVVFEDPAVILIEERLADEEALTSA